MEDIERVTLAQIASVRKKFAESSTSAGLCSEDLARVKNDEMWIRRFVAAQDGDADKATKMLLETCQWRKEFGVNDLNHKTISQTMIGQGTLFVRNQDKWGKAILIFKAKTHTKGVNDMEDVKKFIVYWFERIERQAKSDQITIIFDMKDTGWSNMDMDFIRYLITLLKEYYPYLVNWLLIYDMPWLLKSAWNIIKTWLAKKEVERIKFVDKKSINEYIDESNQLRDWGGSDDYQYKFEAEVKGQRKPSLKPASLNNNLSSSDDSSPEGKNRKVQFTDHDGSVDLHLIDVAERRATAATPSAHDQLHESERRAAPSAATLNQVRESERRAPAATPAAYDQFREPERDRPGQETAHTTTPTSAGDSSDPPPRQHDTNPNLLYAPPLVETNDVITFARVGGEYRGDIEIRNLSNSMVIFKIKTTAPDAYTVHPTIGLLARGAHATVNLIANTRIDEKKHRFQVSAAVVPETLGLPVDPNEGDGVALNSDNFPRINTVWKSHIERKVPTYNKRVGIAIAPDTEKVTATVSRSTTSATRANVVMDEDAMRKGLSELERNVRTQTHVISTKVQSIVDETSRKQLIAFLVLLFTLIAFSGLIYFAIPAQLEIAISPAPVPDACPVPNPNTPGFLESPLIVPPPTADEMLAAKANTKCICS